MSEHPSPLLKLGPGHDRPTMAIFLSGSGSNAEMLLKTIQALPKPPLTVKALVTDAPLTSRAHELGARYHLPVVASDIREFYLRRGENRVSIATPKGQEIRNAWTDDLRARIAPFELDFAVFAGFVPLTNLTRDFPCLNVHPGDLTFRKDGKRLLVGLHTIPIELAILSGLDYLRSSVIIAQTYSGQGGEMDSGPILGISPKVPIDLHGCALPELQAIWRGRPPQRPKGGFDDKLEHIAAANQDNLKQAGDWVVLPQTVRDYAEQRFALDGDDRLLFRSGDTWAGVTTVVYHQDQHRELVPPTP